MIISVKIIFVLFLRTKIFFYDQEERIMIFFQKLYTCVNSTSFTLLLFIFIASIDAGIFWMHDHECKILLSWMWIGTGTAGPEGSRGGEISAAVRGGSHWAPVHHQLAPGGEIQTPAANTHSEWYVGHASTSPNGLPIAGITVKWEILFAEKFKILRKNFYFF